MVSVLDSKVSGSGLTPGWGHSVVFLDNFNLAAPLSLSHFMLPIETRISSCLMGHLACKQT